MVFIIGFYFVFDLGFIGENWLSGGCCFYRNLLFLYKFVFILLGFIVCCLIELLVGL